MMSIAGTRLLPFPQTLLWYRQSKSSTLPVSFLWPKRLSFLRHLYLPRYSVTHIPHLDIDYLSCEVFLHLVIEFLVLNIDLQKYCSLCIDPQKYRSLCIDPRKHSYFCINFVYAYSHAKCAINYLNIEIIK